MRRRQGALPPWLILPLILVVGGCGTNTNSPVYSIFSLLSVGVPAIIDLQPVTTTTPPEFKVSFYVTNQEDDFIGYNLYVTEGYVAPDSPIVGKPYLPSGVEPSFSYSKKDASTLSANLKTKTVTGEKAPPSPILFQYCRYYYFSLKAVLRNGTVSPSSPQVSACIPDSIYCPTTASCQ